MQRVILILGLVNFICLCACGSPESRGARFLAQQEIAAEKTKEPGALRSRNNQTSIDSLPNALSPEESFYLEARAANVQLEDEESLQKSLRRLENDLLAKETTYDARRELVMKGPKGWQIIFRHEFVLKDETDFLRGPWESSKIPEGIRNVFDHAWNREFGQRFQNEAWATRYVQGTFRAYHRQHLCAEEHVHDLIRYYDEPEKAKYAVIYFKVLFNGNRAYKHEFPWAGPKEKQQEAMKKIILFWLDHKSEYESGH